MVLFEKCCCCFGLENGTIAIAILEILSEVYRFIVGLTNSINFHGVSNTLQVTVNIIISVVLILVAALLIFAVLKRLSRYMLPWLGVTAISIICNIIFVIISFASSDTITYATEYRIVLMIAIVFDIYFLLVVHSLYKIIGGDGIRMQRPNQTI